LKNKKSKKETKSMKKKFTFKNLLKNKRVIYSTLTIILIIIFLIVLFFIKNIIASTVFISFVIFFLIFSIIDIHKLKTFMKNYSSKDLKKLEQELNDSIYIDNDWFLTNNYIFYLKKYKFLNYQDISKISTKETINLAGKSPRLEYKIILYTTKNETLTYKTLIKEYNDDFIKALKLKNKDLISK